MVRGKESQKQILKRDSVVDNFLPGSFSCQMTQKLSCSDLNTLAASKQTILQHDSG